MRRTRARRQKFPFRIDLLSVFLRQSKLQLADMQLSLSHIVSILVNHWTSPECPNDCTYLCVRRRLSRPAAWRSNRSALPSRRQVTDVALDACLLGTLQGP